MVEKKQRFSLRKTTVGLVSAAIVGVTVVPLLGTTAFAEEGGEESEATHQQVAQPPTYDVSQWTANPVNTIEQEIQSQLEAQENTQEYEIQWGDTVWGITQAHGLDLQAFVTANSIENPDFIYAGDEVTLDVNGETATNATDDELEENTQQSNDVVEEPANTDEVVSEHAVPAKTPEKTVDTGAEVATNVDNSSEEVEPEQVVVNDPIAPETNDIVEIEAPVEDEQSDESALEETPQYEEIESDEPVEEEVVTDEPVEIPENEAPSKGDVDDETIVEETPAPPETPEEPSVPEDEQEEPTNPEEEQPTESDDEQQQDEIINRVVERSNIIEHGVQYVEDNQLPVGEERVVQDGVDGTRVRQYEQTVVNGQVESETLVSDTVQVEPVDKIVHIGTQSNDVYYEAVTKTRPHPEHRHMTNELNEGDERVIQEGIDRQVEIVYATSIVDGVLQNDRRIVSETIVQEEQPRIVEVGTRNEETEIDWTIDTNVLNQEMLSLINAERVRNGVHPLQYSPQLQEGTDARAIDLAEIGGLRVDGESHVRPDGSSWDGVFDYLDDTDVMESGENTASNNEHNLDKQAVLNGDRTLENALAETFYLQYKDSPGHYDNMMSDNHNVFSTAVSVVPTNNVFGTHELYNVQIFGYDPNLPSQ